MHKNVVYFFRQSWLLIVAAFGFGLLLAFTHSAWEGRIESNQADKFSALARELAPEAKEFVAALEQHSVTLADGSEAVMDIYRGVNDAGQAVAWAFVIRGPGFADKIELIAGVDASFQKLLGYGVLSSNETPGYGDQIKNAYFADQFVGAPAGALSLVKSGNAEAIDETIVAISGATVTSQAMVDIFNNYIGPVRETLRAEGMVE